MNFIFILFFRLLFLKKEYFFGEFLQSIQTRSKAKFLFTKYTFFAEKIELTWERIHEYMYIDLCFQLST